MISRRTLTAASLLVVVVVLATATTSPVDAIPAFSRKYATSCATCHVAFPKLNAFGEAFRNSGYRMPGGDENYLRDENVSLGAEPWKRLWPNAIWPGDIPGLPPVSFIIENEIEHSPDAAVKTDFRTPSDIAMLTGGSLGDSMSWFGRVNLVAPGEDVHVHRFFGQFNRMFGSSLVNLRIGQFETRAVPFSSNQRLAKEDYLLNTATMPLEAWVDYLEGLGDDDHEDEGDDHGDDHDDMLAGWPGESDGHDDGADDHADAGHEDIRGQLIGQGGHQHDSAAFSLGTTQLGVELWGATKGFGGKGGFEYAVGLVNGNGAGDFAATGSNDNNNAKDVYWRASYKLGGMSVMGDPESAPATTNNWQDDSVRFGLFGYHGKAPFTFRRLAEVHHDDEEDEHDHDGFLVGFRDDDHGDLGDPGAEFEIFELDENFRRLGADVDISFGNLNVFGAYAWGRSEMGPAMIERPEITFKSWLGQADYVIYPWLLASLRYERVDYDDAFGDVERWLPHVTALLRANVKLSAEASLYSDDLFGNRYRFWFNFGF